MASLLRQIVAGPRARHPEAGLDLCYVTDFIIATSGPSQTYPQLAYRNPLDQLKAFLDAKHGDNWAIWEFRAEGTGYPDEAVDGRVRHYPWPDHHPPPFRLVPMIMASMRNWLHGGDLDCLPSTQAHRGEGRKTPAAARDHGRVVVVHCKAGKGRSGTVSCSYLISEEGWTAGDALQRFTERRMRPRFGPGVSIPSQLRWVSYVDRWTQHGKRYVDRPIEIVEVHAWGLRSGVKVDVEGFVEDGKKIRVFHTFAKGERLVVEPGTPPDGGLGQMVWDLAGYSVSGAGSQDKVPDEVELADEANAAASTGAGAGNGEKSTTRTKTPTNKDKDKEKEKKMHKLVRKGAGLLQQVQTGLGEGIDKAKTRTEGTTASHASTSSSSSSSEEAEPGGLAVIFRPAEPIRIPNSDVNIAVERRNRTHKSLNLTMVSAVAHVWFNAFFEGRGPEQGHGDDSGVFTIDWEAMDGIKGSSRKGSRALDRLSVVWRAADGGRERGEEIVEPREGEPVPQVAAADWKGSGGGGQAAMSERELGIRAQKQSSADVSRASSLRSVERLDHDAAGAGDNNGEGNVNGNGNGDMQGLKTSGPEGEDLATEGERRADKVDGSA